jgi:iduronate 2-sulfatase
VLLFAVDDLRAQFGEVYQAPEVLTPHLDALSSRDGAVTFRRSYVQYAHCVVSRASILSGRRPGYTSVRTGVPFGAHARSSVGASSTRPKDGKYGPDHCARGWGNYTTLPTYFREHGWVTAGGGKVFHPDTCDGAALGEDRFAWSLPYFHAPCFQWGSLPCRGTESDPQHGKGCGVPSWIANETATDGEVPDGMITDNAVMQLKHLAASGLPWFLAVGLHKP